MNKAVFLDRDGVLLEDADPLICENQIRILPGVSEAIKILAKSGYKLIVVSNQTVISRGLLSEERMIEIHATITAKIEHESGIEFDDFFYCPHHPQASLPLYRIACRCRKPKPGMLLEAASKHNLDCTSSFMVGDRITDCLAGEAVGCKTILLRTGCHTDPPIMTLSPVDLSYKPDFVCDSLLEAAVWIEGMI